MTTALEQMAAVIARSLAEQQALVDVVMGTPMSNEKFELTVKAFQKQLQDEVYRVLSIPASYPDRGPLTTITISGMDILDQRAGCAAPEPVCSAPGCRKTNNVGAKTCYMCGGKL